MPLGGKLRRVRCVSIRQHWTNAAVHGLKWCENRTRWDFGYRGTVYIHASRTVDGPVDRHGLHEPRGVPVVTGAIIGTAYLHAVVPMDEMQDFLNRAAQSGFEKKLRQGCPGRPDMTERQFVKSIDFCEGPLCLILIDRKPLLQPIYIPGRLGLFEADIPIDQGE